MLSIASAGDNSLALLAHGAKVVAVDISLAQLAFLELRKTAIARLDYQGCLAFLGIIPHSSRLSIYKRLRSELNAEARAFWDQRPEAVAQGIIHAGKFEHYFRLFRRWVLPCIHNRGRIVELLRRRTRQERLEFYDKCWANRRWFWLFRHFFSRATMARMGGHPTFFEYVVNDLDLTQHWLEHTRFALTELDTADNPYLSYILSGNFGQALPDYLQPGTFAKLRANRPALTTYLGGTEDAVSVFGMFDGFNLSDIFEYVNEATTAAIYGRLLDHAQSGARIAYWNMMVTRTCPRQYRTRVRSLDTVAEQLFKRDRGYFYGRFVVEEAL